MSKIFCAIIIACAALTSVLGVDGIIAAPRSQKIVSRHASFDNICKLYCYTIKEVSSFGGTLIFEDGSSWNIGLYAMGTVSGWEVGDQVALWSEGSSLPKPFTLFNVAKQQSAPADLKSLSKKHSIRGLWITHVSEEGAAIYLNNGVVLCSPHYCFRHRYFCEGSRAFILSNIEGEQPCYSLWLENGVIAIDLELLQ